MSQDSCKKYACQLQYCLQANDYMESKCVSAINKLIKCCQDFYSNNSTHVSEHCSGFIQLNSTQPTKTNT